MKREMFTDTNETLASAGASAVLPQSAHFTASALAFDNNMNAVIETNLALQFGTWIRGKLRFSNKVLAVADFRDASDKWCAIRDAENLGASDSPVCMVVDTRTGKQVAKISYNGRVWDTDGKEIA